MDLIVASLTFWHTIPYNKVASFPKTCKRCYLVYVNSPAVETLRVLETLGSEEQRWSVQTVRFSQVEVGVPNDVLEE